MVSDVNEMFKEATSLIKAMDVEQRNFESGSKARCTQQLAQFRADLNNLRRDFDRAKDEMNRDYLFDISQDPELV